MQLTSTSEWKPYSEFSNISDIQTEPINNHIDYDTHRAENLYDLIQERIIISGINAISKDKTLTPELLAKMWHITLPIAKNTLNVTSNNYVRTNEGKLSRRFRTDFFQKHYRRLGGPYSRFYTDTIFF